VSELEFSGGAVIRLEPGDIVLIVGPNNAGKSATLRAIRDKLSSPLHDSPVVDSVKISSSGNADDVENWLPTITRRIQSGTPDTLRFQAYGVGVFLSQARNWWSTNVNGLQQLGRFFCHMLTADERLAAANPAQAVDLLHDSLTHPIHSLQLDDRLEERLSKQFRKAFGLDLIVNRGAGSLSRSTKLF
jgi:ABC-type phosphate/phosphonate transport system ATPase subunit